MLHAPLPAGADAPTPAALAPDRPGPAARPPPPPPRRKPLSEILSDIAADPMRAFLAIAELIALLGGRGRAALILLFAAPDVLPAPPGVSGLPLLYLAVQLMQGRLPWLPQAIGARGMPRNRWDGASSPASGNMRKVNPAAASVTTR
ncbi:MAG: exopolysaccharide biosynthesis protein [Gemmobacter sp.]|uniref:exopolysaccharide biosynthesis protein n=1 Tax=Gemmobacter sp. TaxID=1898957 RepID=UPI00391C3BD3